MWQKKSGILMSLDLTRQFAEQVTVNQLVQNIVYASSALSVG